MRNFVAVVVLHIEVYLSLLDLHQRTARTLTKVFVCLEQLVKFTLCDFVLDNLWDVLSDLAVADDEVTGWTAEFSQIDPCYPRLFDEALFMHEVEAIIALDHHLLLVRLDFLKTPRADVMSLLDCIPALDLLKQLALLIFDCLCVSLIVCTRSHSDQAHDFLVLYLVHLRVLISPGKNLV